MTMKAEQSLMESALLGRQPIFDGQQRVFAYELLYRDGVSNAANVRDGNEATARVFVNAFCELGFDHIVGEAQAFLNMTEGLLLDRSYEILPAGQVVLEVLETVEPTPELIAVLAQARAQGYRVALDDFVFGEAYRELVEVADFIKFDVLALSAEELEAQMRQMTAYPLRFLAEKVENHEVFSRCRELGFELFQGYYFCKPEIVKGARMAQNRLSLVMLLAKLQQEDITIRELEELIRTDLALSVKLLRYVNSAFVGLPRSVDSISQAVGLVGTERMRQWAAVMVLANFEEKPIELMRVALVRARMCEQCCVHHRQAPAPGFTVGLFSVLDAFFDCEMSELLNKLPLSAAIQMALLEKQGTLGEVLRAVTAYEQGEWDAVMASPYEPDLLRTIFWDSMRWAEDVLKSFR